MNKKKLTFIITLILTLCVYYITSFTKTSHENKKQTLKKFNQASGITIEDAKLVPAKVPEKKENSMPSIPDSNESVNIQEVVLSEQEFHEGLQDILQQIPKKGLVKKEDEDKVHHIPDFLIHVGKRLGGIKNIIEKQPELAPIALDFYYKCAKENSSLNSIRALCYVNIVELSQSTSKQVNTDGISPEVIELANNILELE